jgi:thioredoxin 1
MNTRILILVLSVSFLFSSCKKDEAPIVLEPGSNLKEITSLASFESEIKTGVSMMYFHATWCSICNSQKPNIEATANNADLKAFKFGIVDKDKHTEIATKFNISGQPVTVFFKDGVEKQRLLGGGHSVQKLKDILLSIK